MKQPVKMVVLGLCALGFLAAEQSTETPFGLALLPEAGAVVGVPWSPASVAGVARRTTRRALVVSSSAAVAAAPQQAAPAPAPAPVQPAGAPPIGTVVSTLPGGCVASPKGGVQYYDCAGVYYRAAFQGNNLVYVVQQP
jgi:hypothetical protein